MVDRVQLSLRGFLVWGICALFYLFEFLIRTVLGSFQPQLMADLHLSSMQFSLLSTALFLLVYGFMQLPVGFIIDSLGLKKALLIGSFTCTVGIFGFSLSHTFAYALFFRIFMGFGASFGFISLLVSVSEWMPLSQRGVFIGLSQFIGTMGPMIATGPLETLLTVTSVSWRTLFFIFGIIGSLITLLVIGFVTNNTSISGKYIILHRSEPLRRSFSRLFFRWQPWVVSVLSVCFYFTIEYLSESEGRLFLLLKGFSLNTASYMLSISWIGYALGCPLLGWISDKIQRRKNIIIGCSFLGLAAILGILFTTSKEALFLSFFALGVSACGQSLGLANMAEEFQKKFIAIGFGLNNAFVMTVAAINAPLISYIIELTASGHVRSISDYFPAFYILIALACIAMVISIFFLKETFGKSQVEPTIIYPLDKNK